MQHATRVLFYEGFIALRLRNDPLYRLSLQWHEDPMAEWHRAQFLRQGELTDKELMAFGMDAPLRAKMGYTNNRTVEIVWGGDAAYKNGRLGYQLRSGYAGVSGYDREGILSWKVEDEWFRRLDYLDVLRIVSEIQAKDGGRQSLQMPREDDPKLLPRFPDDVIPGPRRRGIEMED